jgi:hypothetical protein
MPGVKATALMPGCACHTETTQHTFANVVRTLRAVLPGSACPLAPWPAPYPCWPARGWGNGKPEPSELVDGSRVTAERTILLESVTWSRRLRRRGGELPPLCRWSAKQPRLNSKPSRGPAKLGPSGYGDVPVGAERM